MSLLKIEVDADNELGRTFTDLERKNVPFAAMQASNAVAFEIRQVWARTAARVFDRPTAMTIKAAQYTKATLKRLYATVFLRNEALKGTPPARYLLPQVQGGERPLKPVERLLQARGALPAGMFAVPGKGADLDAHGNLQASTINQVLSQLGARRDPLQNQTDESRDRRRARAAKRGTRGAEYFAQGERRGRLLPGIYERVTTGFGSALRSLLIFVRRPRYQARFDIFRLAERQWNKLMPFHFKRELEKAVQTSKYRGRG